jgi:Kef-type K+ transport system membrane component KefB
VRRALSLVAIVTVMLLSLAGYGVGEVFPAATGTLSFGFLLLAAYIFGDALTRFGLPKITGYILAGILFGPHVLGFVSTDTVKELKLIDDLALTFIAFAAGGELRLKELRNRRKCILLTVVFLTSVVFLGIATFVVLGRGMFPFLVGRPLIHVVAVAALLGTFAVARSPSSAIAIISECKARGPFTEMVLGVTVVMDVSVIIIFAIIVSISQVAVVPGSSFDLTLLGTMSGEIVGAIIAGIGLGGLVVLYIKRVRADLALFILGVAFLVTFFSKQSAHLIESSFGVHMQFEPMLMCLAAGFIVQNYSKEGRVFMEKIDHSSLPVYVIFFALTGAALNIMALEDTWVVALVVVGLRCALIWVGAYLGAFFAKDPAAFRVYSGPSFITQAGVSLGLAGIVMKRFPEWGTQLATLIVAVIAINQVIGPGGFKFALNRVGEAKGGKAA